MHKIKLMQKISTKLSTLATKSPGMTLAELAFFSLRQDVLNGNFEPDHKLKVDELQHSYGVSSSPLREALNRLAQEGLVKADERRGFRVPQLSATDMQDITRMRLLLDLQALREAIAIGDDAWEAAIVASFHRLEKMEQRFGDGPILLDDEWTALHRDFHQTLISACPSDRNLAWSASLFDQAERYRRFSARNRLTPHNKHREHQRLMEAVLQRDAGTACVLLAEHMRGTQRNVEAALLRLGATPTTPGA